MPARSVRHGQEEHAEHDPLLDVYQGAALLGLKSPRTLYKLAYAGRVRSYKIGRAVRFRRSDLAEFIAAGERPAFASPDGFPLTPSVAAR
jgi:excisionase family DNA binding protein